MTSMKRAEVDWQTLDKAKFFVVGGALFTGLTTCLFPLSVIKTRQMALENAPRGFKGAYHTAAAILRHDGPRGLYKGFGTVIAGAIPARIVYLSTLEVMKDATSSLLHAYRLSEAANAGLASFVAGGAASLVAQSVVVPVDVVAQRLMIMGGGAPSGSSSGGGGGSSGSLPSGPSSSSSGGGGSGGIKSSGITSPPAQQAQRMTGLQVAQRIVAREGVRGLYRGFGASVIALVPNSAIWWGCYGAYGRLFWQQIDAWRGEHRRNEGEMLAVEATAGIITGFTAAFITNPLDVAKTQLQTRDVVPGAARPTFIGVVGQLARDEGMKGFYRGVVPRMFNSAIWGTAMVTLYEFLKRLCALPPQEPASGAP